MESQWTVDSVAALMYPYRALKVDLLLADRVAQWVAGERVFEIFAKHMIFSSPEQLNM